MNCWVAIALAALGGLMIGVVVTLFGMALYGDQLLPENDDAAWKPSRPRDAGPPAPRKDSP